jgi:formamidopyrimidine-DNA glycosylase
VAVPELPELEVLRDYLGPRLDGKRVIQVWTSPKLSFLLRTPPEEFARQLTGGTFERTWRRGKFLIFDISGHHLVINPMLGGRMQWTTASEKVVAATVFRLTLDGGEELRFLDTVKMGRVYWVPQGALPTIPGWAELGPDALTVTESDFAQRIRRHPGELKNLLRNQAFIAGIGNAYSDEILHEAGLLPLRKRTTLKPDEMARLYQATGKVLAKAIEAIKAQPKYEPHKQDRTFMAVHGKAKEKCPRCGHRISELTARGEATDFCRGCQH